MNINNLGKFVILWLCLQILSFLQIGDSLAKTYESETYEIKVKEVGANATLARNNAVDYAYLRAYYQFVADLLSKYRVSLHNFGSRNADFSRGDNFDNRDYNYNSYDMGGSVGVPNQEGDNFFNIAFNSSFANLAKIKKYVIKHRFHNEQITENSYQASIIITLDGGAVKDDLVKSYGEIFASPHRDMKQIFILPIGEFSGEATSWNGGSAWYLLWQEVQLQMLDGYDFAEYNFAIKLPYSYEQAKYQQLIEYISQGEYQKARQEYVALGGDAGDYLALMHIKMDVEGDVLKPSSILRVKFLTDYQERKANFKMKGKKWEDETIFLAKNILASLDFINSQIATDSQQSGQGLAYFNGNNNALNNSFEAINDNGNAEIIGSVKNGGGKAIDGDFNGNLQFVFNFGSPKELFLFKKIFKQIIERVSSQQNNSESYIGNHNTEYIKSDAELETKLGTKQNTTTGAKQGFAEPEAWRVKSLSANYTILEIENPMLNITLLEQELHQQGYLMKSADELKSANKLENTGQIYVIESY